MFIISVKKINIVMTKLIAEIWEHIAAKDPGCLMGQETQAVRLVVNKPLGQSNLFGRENKGEL